MSIFVAVSYLALWLIVVALAITVIALAKQIGLLYGRLPQYGARTTNEGPDLDKSIERFVLQDIYGSPVQVPSSSHPRTLLVFMSTTCSVCDAILPSLRSLAVTEGDTAVVIQTGDGDVERTRVYAAQHGISHLPFVLSKSLNQQFGIWSAPYAVVVDKNGVVRAKGVVNGREHLDSLLSAVDLGQPTLQSFAQARATRTQQASV